MEKPNKKYEFTKVTLELWSPNERNDGGFVLRWGCKGVGFGEFAFAKEGDKVVCDNECMGKGFILETFKAFLDTVELDWEVVDGKMVRARGAVEEPASEEDRQKIIDLIREGKVELPPEADGIFKDESN